MKNNFRWLMSCLLVFAIATYNAWGSDSSTPVTSTSLNEKSTFEDYLNKLKVRTFLNSEDVRTYSSNLESLVGEYFYMSDAGEVVRLGRPDGIPKATTFQLKDKIEYQATTTDGGNINTSLPWLSSIFKKEYTTTILMQDLATVIGTSDPNTIKDHFPKDLAPDNTQVWFISGATVTLISATRYAKNSFDGSSIIQLGGSKLYMQNILQNAWVISLNKVPANKITATKLENKWVVQYGSINPDSIVRTANIINDPLDGKIIKFAKVSHPNQ